MRILLAGDTHGEKNQVNYLHQIAYNEKITTIVQVGDFGYGWPEREPFIDYVSMKAEKLGTTWYWLDGNHENFDALETEPVDLSASEPQLIRPNVWYLPRGCTWVWDEKRFMALGGAYSIDKDWRTPHVSWWAQETITDDDVQRAKAQGVVDVLLSHDAPEGACPLVGPGNTVGYENDLLSQMNRQKLSDVIQTAKPRLVVHGHMHFRYDVMIPRAPLGDWVDVVGLGNDGQGRASWVILDVPTLTIENQS